MASPLPAALSALAALMFFGAVGLPIARRLFEDRSFAIAVAPALGWALFSAAALPILCVIGFGAASVAALAATAIAATVTLHMVDRNRAPVGRAPGGAAVPAFAYGVAAALGAAVAFTLLPKWGPDGVLLSGPLFDHSKVAIIDEIVRNGLPAQNPFYGDAGTQTGLAYYYLWHFSAAMLALLPGVSGWEADIGLTWFTTFAIVSLMMGLAVRASERPGAAYWISVLSLTAWARWILDGLFGEAAVKAWLPAQPVFAFIPQVLWAPQHGAGAACILISALLIVRLSRRGDWLTSVCLGLTAAAGFGASVWVGGFVFAVTAIAVGAFACATSARRGVFVLKAMMAAGIAALAASPILLEQLRAATVRPEGVPVAFRPQNVLGSAFGDWAQGPIDIVAYWLIQLPYDLPAIAPAGALFLAIAVFGRAVTDEPTRLARVFALVALASFGVASSFASVLLNNDLGWRAALPGILVLMIYAAAGLSGCSLRPIRAVMVAQAFLLMIGLGGGVAFARHWMNGFPSASAAEFVRSPELWRAVRDYVGPTDRIATNPLLLADVTPWPINISWALFADRRSCYASWEFARAFAPISLEAANEMQRRFKDVFAGLGTADETFRLLQSRDCRVVVLTPTDGAWASDPFARDQRYRLAQARPGRWRIYLVQDAQGSRPQR